VLNISIHDDNPRTLYYVVVPNDPPGAVSSTFNRTLGSNGATVRQLYTDGRRNMIYTGGQTAYLYVVTLLQNVVGITVLYNWDASGGTIPDSDVKWLFDDHTGVITISGSGPMPNFEDNNPPWGVNRQYITTAIIEYGITTIGAFAFHGSNLTDMTIPDRITAIGRGAFYNSNLARIYFTSATPPDIGEDAFQNIAPNSRAIVPSSWEAHGVSNEALWHGLIVEFIPTAIVDEPHVEGMVPGIVRGIIVNIWGRPGLLYNNNIYGVAIPPVLFNLVDTTGWREWFEANHSWDPTL
jgi:hypothetical protein